MNVNYVYSEVLYIKLMIITYDFDDEYDDVYLG